MIDRLSITVLVDDQAGPGLHAEHGLALWIEAGDLRILFDTGQGAALIANAETLGIDLSRAEIIVVSHGHYDHTGNLARVLATAPDAVVYIHREAIRDRYHGSDEDARSIGMPTPDRSAVHALTPERIHWTGQPTKITPDIGLTGAIPREAGSAPEASPFFLDPEHSIPDDLVDDQALWIRTGDGLVVVTGCCHAGLLHTLQAVRRITRQTRIHAVIGGLHLGRASEDVLEAVGAGLQAMEVQQVIPCHCTGEAAVRYLTAALRQRVRPGQAGLHWSLDHPVPTSSSVTQFDASAATWDEDPRRRASAAALFKAMRDRIPMHRSWHVLDYGAGTGLVTLPVAAQVASVTAVDASEGMLAVLRAKAGAAGITNLRTLHLDEDAPSLSESFDWILTTMVLHHVQDIPALLDRFQQWLKPNGWLSIADLEPEDGSFHGEGRSAFHHGIDPEGLTQHLTQHGFHVQYQRSVHVMQREQADGGVRAFPVFLLYAYRG